MTKAEIMQASANAASRFETEIDGTRYETKGIFHSEMLMLVAIVRALGIKTVIESGRARGQSTEIMARCFRDEHTIHSIEYDQYTRDARIARQRLHGYNNVQLHFGDAFDVLPGLINDRCCVLIDGPKGDEALRLAVDCLKSPLVAAVFLHDFHQDTTHRELMETLFDNTFSSDDKDFLEKFARLDEECWKEQAKTKPGWGPYKRGVQVMKSYSATLTVVFNGENAVNEDACREYFLHRPPARTGWRALRHRLAVAALQKAPRIAAAPYWFAMQQFDQLRETQHK